MISIDFRVCLKVRYWSPTYCHIIGQMMIFRSNGGALHSFQTLFSDTPIHLLYLLNHLSQYNLKHIGYPPVFLHRWIYIQMDRLNSMDRYDKNIQKRHGLMMTDMFWGQAFIALNHFECHMLGVCRIAFSTRPLVKMAWDPCVWDSCGRSMQRASRDGLPKQKQHSCLSLAV